MNKSSYSQYLRTYAITLFCGLAVVATINATVDPQGRTNLVSLPGWNEAKTTLNPEGRIAKALALHNCEYDYIIAGTSRANIGIYPGYAGFEGKPAYNTGAPNANFLEIARIVKYAVEEQRPDAVTLGIDFFAFTDESEVTFDFPMSRYAGSADPYLMLKYLMGKTTLIETWQTISDNRNAPPGSLDACGHNGMDDRRHISLAQRDVFNRVLPRFVPRYWDNDYAADRSEAYGDLLRWLRARDIPVYTYISPIHALQIEILTDLELVDTFIQWKYDLAAQMEALNAGLPIEDHITLWDFSGYNSITTETVPTDNSIQMKWYRESSHFRAATGDMILDRIMGKQKADNRYPDDFGTPLNMQTVESVVDTMWAGQARYRQDHPDEMQRLRVLIDNKKIEMARNERRNGSAPGNLPILEN